MPAPATCLVATADRQPISTCSDVPRKKKKMLIVFRDHTPPCPSSGDEAWCLDIGSNGTIRASTSRWGHTLREPHLLLRSWNVSTLSLSKHVPIRSCCLCSGSSYPCPALTAHFCNKAHMSRRRWLVFLHRSAEHVAYPPSSTPPQHTFAS
ncbi:hypothetical protein F5Y17DRAFT_90293 [Xylariaceae sp. FL0594]|nr:hypothetical protein F5Y17DRAFT_90293 [Xylariaceae sp. FL0594]